MQRLFWICLAAALGGCAGATTGDDSGTPTDSGTTQDSGTPPDSGGGNDGGSADAGDAGGGNTDSGIPPSDGGIPPALTFTCAANTAPIHPNPCPALSGASGTADFCYRPGWTGVTSVEVWGGFGQSTDWKQAFLTLTNDGTGTFTGSATLPNGSYLYIFRTYGGVDGVVRSKAFFNDQENPQFEHAPDASPFPRSVSVLTVPQPTPSLVHLRGTVAYQGSPESCFSVDLEAGEMIDGGHVISEHGTANYAETLADGTFDFTVAANSPYQAIVRYPFLLALPDGGYPDPFTTPSVGITKTGLSAGAADVTLPPADIAYPLTNYQAMSPTGGSGTLPVTFQITVLPGSAGAQASVIGTNIAGNDPLYSSGYTMATSVLFDGGLGGMNGSVQPGRTYWWGAWQEFKLDGGTWTEESLLFPIVFH